MNSLIQNARTISSGRTTEHRTYRSRTDLLIGEPTARKQSMRQDRTNDDLGSLGGFDSQFGHICSGSEQRYGSRANGFDQIELRPFVVDGYIE